MSTYIPFARSSYFKVKDPVAFEAFSRKWDLEMIRGGENEELFGFLGAEEVGIPSGHYDADTDDWVEGGFMEELARHLVDGWVAIVREIGFEKMRYLVGYTVAVNAAGETIEVSLNQIYDDAKRLGRDMTECED